MTTLTLDQALPLIQRLARQKASAFTRCYHLAPDERDDIASHLVLAFLVSWPKFDNTRASVRTFASRLMDKELVSVLRYRLAKMRQVCALPEAADDAHAIVRNHFHVDLERALAASPKVIRDTARALSWYSAIDAAKVVGCSRQSINNRKGQIRRALLSAGIRSDYFDGGGRS